MARRENNHTVLADYVVVVGSASLLQHGFWQRQLVLTGELGQHHGRDSFDRL
jgi:hypothetical protein